jgi:hypothetical protein
MPIEKHLPLFSMDKTDEFMAKIKGIQQGAFK